MPHPVANERVPTIAHTPPWRWTNRFERLGAEFHTALLPWPMPDAHWVAHSPSCAALLGLPDDWWQRPDWQALEVFSGNALWPGMRPLASVYSGHQFGVWAGQLGDGRALWLGEVDTPGGPQEVQLKGAGLTPYSRMGDGRAVLRSSIREFLCSEAMHGLGFATTRALCVTTSPLPVRRETMETTAVVTRVAPSFIRFGHFEHFAHSDQLPALRQLVDFVIDAHFLDCRDASSPALALLDTVARRTAEMVAQWQAVGFCHGVMNTDNMSILGLTIDYGPFGFLDGYDPGHICNHSDHQGRYAFARQPNVAFWNLHALAHALLPLIGDQDTALEAIESYRSTYLAETARRRAAKFGFATQRAGDAELIDGLYTLMAAERTDHTLLFRRLGKFSTDDAADQLLPPHQVRDMFSDREAFDAWGLRYRDRLRAEGSVDEARRADMNRVNPCVVLRNHLADVAIRHARDGHFGEVERLLKVLAHPYDEALEASDDAGFPPDWAQHIEVSCSS